MKTNFLCQTLLRYSFHTGSGSLPAPASKSSVGFLKKRHCEKAGGKFDKFHRKTNNSSPRWRSPRPNFTHKSKKNVLIRKRFGDRVGLAGTRNAAECSTTPPEWWSRVARGTARKKALFWCRTSRPTDRVRHCSEGFEPRRRGRSLDPRERTNERLRCGWAE